MEGEKSRGSFSGRVGLIMAAAGAAVGLGNLWRFPYLAEQYGGGIFLLVYLLMVAVFGLTLIITEMALGRRTGRSCIDAFESISKRFRFIGWLTALVPIIIVPYYCVVGGWILNYFSEYAMGAGDHLIAGSYFDDFVSISLDGVFENPFFWFLVFILMTLPPVAFGVEKGIEKISKVLLPAFFLILVGICVYMFTVPGIVDGLRYYLVPDFDKLSLGTFTGALGQMFFSLSVSSGALIAYGSYARKDTNLTRSAISIASMDTLAAFIAGMIIVPAVVVFCGPGMNSGFGLMFDTMPLVFDTMPAGDVIAVVFFLLAIVAAWTSSIALAEAVVSSLVDRFNISRMKACGVCAAVILILGSLACLGFGPLSGLQPLGMTFLGFFDFLSNSLMMPLAALLLCIVIGYYVKTKYIMDELEINGRFRPKAAYNILVRYVCPIGMIIILVTCILGTLGIYTI